MIDEYIGYLKYSGKLVGDGYFDAKKAAQALVGFDGALRYFVLKQNPNLSDLSFEIPVKIQTGSWQALIPSNIGEWILAGVGISATKYASTALKKMAENDFKNIGFKSVFQKSIKGMQWVIQIGKHLGNITQKQIEKPKFSQNSTVVGIPNSSGQYLNVPKEFLDWYSEFPPKLLSELARLIEVERELSIGINENGKVSEVKITVNEKYYFTFADDASDVVFPQFTHGQKVELEGEVTRGNEITNSIGFKYEEHILSCRPKEGNIVAHKEALFRKCRITGVIDRTDELGVVAAKKPKIVFSKITPIDKKNDGPTLF